MLDTKRDKRSHTLSCQRLSDTFHQHVFHDMNRETSKLRTYKLLKTKIGYENYLSEIENVKQRITLTKFRLSNHALKQKRGDTIESIKTKEFVNFAQPIQRTRYTLYYCAKRIRIFAMNYLIGSTQKETISSTCQTTRDLYNY